MKRFFLFVVFIITLLSICVSFSASSYAGKFLYKNVFIKHVLWLGLGWAMMLITGRKKRDLYDFSVFLYVACVILLVLVLFFGKKISGAQRWFSFGLFSLQPSEFMKLGVVCILSCWWHRYYENINFFMSGWQTFLHEFLIPFVLVLIPAGLVFVQPDLGTAFFYIFLFIFMYLFLPLRKKYILLFLAFCLAVSPILLPHLKDYQKKRLLVFLNPQEDPLGAGYTIVQAKIAIGSGGTWGKGFMSGTQNQLNFLPERRTDFIFSVYAEEWGFLGNLGLILLFFFVLYSILKARQNSILYFDKIYFCGVYMYLILHVFINLGMNMGFLPVVGLPLPFFTYGGSHTMPLFFILGTALPFLEKHERFIFKG